MTTQQGSKRTVPSSPFTAAEARDAGISRHDLSGPAYRRLFHGMYAEASVAVTPLLLAKAALRVSPAGSHASHHTAARIWGAWVPDDPLVHVCSPRGTSRCQRRGIGAHECRHPDGDATEGRPLGVVTRHGVAVSGPVRLFLEMAPALRLVDLVVLGDSLVRKDLTTPDRLLRAAAAWKGAGAVAARRAAGFVRKDVDSPMETRLRMLIVLAGLPEPLVNHRLREANGDVRRRFDLCYRELRLVIEYDGRHHAEDDHQWDHDIDRREELDEEKWRVIIVRSKGIWVEPGHTLDRIVRAMRSQGATGLPRALNDEWRAHFPGRVVGNGSTQA
ncbi:MAG TPA: DUF559 domain-containing protein [Segeticoccus sp.]|uniref:DUF559 domain-containing protein n=1 Tax=Segeticoccus sp. TaxID=2706531 RepID=UPI002D806E1B|nr:DUF559 domain-containing protein [Segeticoccus sp.]HET8598991.1 DUF559 domain-containing protein [Segeticoccus sp.]